MLDVEPTRLLELGDHFEVDLLRLVADPDEAARGLSGLEHAFTGVKVLGARRGDEYFGESPIDVTLAAGDDSSCTATATASLRSGATAELSPSPRHPGMGH